MQQFGYRYWVMVEIGSGQTVTRMRRVFGLVFCVVLAGLMPRLGAAEVLLYKGDHVYVLPQRVARKMLELASRDQWHHFNDMNRNVDVDGDGQNDFHAIALGAQGGYGVQIRYRLHEDSEPDAYRLGRWYWGIITGPDRTILMEAFNL